MIRIEQEKAARISLPIAVALVVILIWHIIVTRFEIHEYLFPSPLVVLSVFLESYNSLLYHAGITIFEAVCGFVIGCSLAFIFGSLLAQSSLIQLAFYPYIIAIKTIPVVAIAPLLIIWFGSGIISKIIISALICFFPMVINTVRGLRTPSIEAIDLFTSYSASRWQTFSKLRLPMALPYILSALKISSTFSLIGAIVGELAGSNAGLGYVILVSSYQLETPQMFSAVIMTAILGIGFFGLIAFIEGKTVSWNKLGLIE